jgi:hypothetical protein
MSMYDPVDFNKKPIGNYFGGAPVQQMPSPTFKPSAQYQAWLNSQKTGASQSGTATSTPAAPSAADKFFSGVLSGENLPFSPFQKSQMLSQASDMSAAAESALNNRMTGNAAFGGASANDPSLQAARLSNQAARQAQNQTAARDIDTQANERNFSAQMAAAEALNRNQLQREAWDRERNNAFAQGPGPAMMFGGAASGGMGGQSRPSAFVGGFSHNMVSNAADPFGAGITKRASFAPGEWGEENRNKKTRYDNRF